MKASRRYRPALWRLVLFGFVFVCPALVWPSAEAREPRLTRGHASSQSARGCLDSRLRLADSSSPFGDLFGSLFFRSEPHERSRRTALRKERLNRLARRMRNPALNRKTQVSSSKDQPPERQSARHAPLRSRGETYSTFCVRVCDGYYWPMNFSTSRSSFKRDAERCQASCAAETRLFIIKTPTFHSQDQDEATPELTAGMADLGGRKYSEAENAFLYRTVITPDCRCRADPYQERVAAERQRSAARARFFASLAAARAEREAAFLQRRREMRRARFLSSAKNLAIADEARSLRLALRRYGETLLSHFSPQKPGIEPEIETKHPKQPAEAGLMLAPVVILPRQPPMKD